LKPIDILKFWRDVEIFDIPNFDKNTNKLKEIKDGEKLPWFKETDSSIKPTKKGYKKYYTLIFGKIKKKCISERLNTLLESNDDSETNKFNEFTCLSAFALSENGNLQQNRYFLANYIFGINILEKKGDLSEISSHIKNIQEDFLERLNIPKDFLEEKPQEGDENKISWEHIKKEIEYLSELTSSWRKEDISVFLKIDEIPQDNESNIDFLNSFYIDDLIHLSSLEEEEEEEEEKDLSTALQQYLTSDPKEANRINLIQNKEELFKTINPEKLTAGRWPSKTDYGLYTAQLGAINTIFSNLREGKGIQGINGPPGTGKTTLLFDVIAEIIVDRAKIISEIGPKLFIKHEIIKKETFEYNYYTLNEKLQKNFGIVVASNNNKAVENISKVLPSKSKIDTKTFEADYFSEFSKSLIDNENSQNNENNSWGILATALGNSTNKSRFKNNFWGTINNKENSSGFNSFLYGTYCDDKTNNKEKLYCDKFEEEKENFKKLLNDFEDFKKLASDFHELLPKFIESKKQEKQNKKELEKINTNLSKLSKEKQDILDEKNNVNNEFDKLKSICLLHINLKPSFFFFQKIFNTNSFKKWNSKSNAFFNDVLEKKSELKKLSKREKNTIKEIRSSEQNQERLIGDLKSLGDFFNKYNEKKIKLEKEYEIETKNLFDKKFYSKDLKEIHLLNPYHSPKIAKNRSDIFLSALNLHRYAILVNAKEIRNNLEIYFDMTAGRVKLEPEKAQNLWDTLFLCVPVVSTTLASASRLFPNTNKEQIGWLLIDEAGQATPQSAVGLIHRAKRCVIVGDPLQLEPVVTIPEQITKILKEKYIVEGKKHKVEGENKAEVDWSPHRVSVQKLADRVSKMGTYMNVGKEEEEIWTGFPLRTHRRCYEPMFSIANSIAYNGQMVSAMEENQEEEFIVDSCWYDIKGGNIEDRHIVVEEITCLEEKIKELRETFEGEIFVISPFRDVAEECRSKLSKDKKVSCGTIHTFQGKEADAVFLVLGSDTNRTETREWAYQKPNLLNVALTRAKKRLYVIGNRKSWASYNYFSTMDKGLEKTLV